MIVSKCNCLNCTCSPQQILEAKTSKYWRTPAGIKTRIEMLSQHFTYQVINNSLMFYGQSTGINYVRWITHPERTQTGPCVICEPLDGRIFRKGMFLPALPAHANCVCSWELLIEPTQRRNQ